MSDAPNPWPRLTQTLPPLRGALRCQQCGNPLVDFWQEHDHRDQPEPRAEALCLRCSTAIIGPHPRLYRRLQKHEPFPGVMAICGDCTHRRSTQCTHKDLKANGGPGLSLNFPRPNTAFVDRRDRRTGKRIGERVPIYNAAPICRGHAQPPTSE